MRPEMILPQELWCETFAYSKPYDVLMLSQTCRALHIVVSQRSVWVEILMRLCDRYGLFKPSYPVHEMDLTQLQRAALGPTLFQRVLKRGAVPADTLNQARELKVRSVHGLGNFISGTGVPPNSGSGDRWIFYRHLVPGGRFLAQVRQSRTCSAFGNNFVIELWDLGMAGQSPLAPPILVASKVYDCTGHRNHAMYSVTSSFSNKATETLRIAISTGHPTNGHIIKILTVSPAHAEPFFQELSSIHVKLDSDADGLNQSEPIIRGGLMLIRVDDSFIIWDFISHLYSIISLGAIDRGSEPYVFTEDLVIMFDHWGAERKVDVWKVPAREEFTQISSHKAEVSRGRPVTAPDWILPIPWPTTQDDCMTAYIPVSAAALPLAFDVFCSHVNDGVDRPTGPDDMAPGRTITRGLRCTLSYSDDANLAIQRLSSFTIQAPVTSAPRPRINFAPTLLGSTLGVGALTSFTKDRSIYDPSPNFAVFAYYLSLGVTHDGLQEASSLNTSSGGELKEASVSVVRMHTPGSCFVWSACFASGRFVGRGREAEGAVLLDYLN
ncbi:hypothetical protein DFP72DRAFT_904518 [Ephemerocybe angulata]|uniref:F-box domain-containing protein n=1 Tax=Ephemerocybe angulata TaxID=980116 RepID=A0A8H6M237_9AGAR|nr:hypothetical protein DFP72DRAFT_904518 [Tulosesus angulatus]